MRPTHRRVGIAAMLVLTMLAHLLLLSIPAAAEDADDSENEYWNNQTAASASRFMSELFFGSDGKTYRVSGDSITLPLSANGQSISYSTVTVPTVYDTPNNAVRFVLTNYSTATYFHVKYTYVTDQGPRTETQRVDMSAYSARCTYLVRIDDADSLVNMTLILPESAGNSIILHAMEAVRVWSDGLEEHGTVQSCTYNSTAKTVTVKGSVYHDVMIAASDGTLGLFRLSPEQTVEELINDPEATPVVTSSLSISFELQTTAADVASRFARYAVLICLPDGTRLPLSGARYAVTADGETERAAARSDFKGIDTTLTSGAVDSNVGSAIVDVYLNRLENDRQSGYLYTVENEYFYFNRAYLAELDATVRSLSGAACKVYLRFLVESDGTAIACAVSAEGEESAPAAVEDPSHYRALCADDAESLRYLYAYTTFLCSRYNGTGQGEIAGIIVGSRVDESTLFNAAGQLTLPEYVTLYGQALSVISLAAKDVTPTLSMVVPVSDGWNAELIGDVHRRGDYTAELFLESLAAYLTAHGANVFSTMIESTHNPYGLDNAYFEPINTDGMEGPIPEELIPKLVAAAQDSDYLSSENIVLLDTYLIRYAAQYAALSDNYLFHWTPDRNTGGNALSASYIYHYYRLFSDPHACAFFVSFREHEESGDLTEFSKIKYLVKYIDTSSGSYRTEFALDIFGVDSWTTLISAFDRAKTEQMTLLEGAFGERADESVAGTYPLFDFTIANSTRGWYAGNYCRSLSVVTSERYGKTLDAVMTADLSTLAEYSDIAYRFDVPLDLRSAPYLTLTFAVDCETDTDAVFEVKLVLGSDEGYMEAKQVVKNGETVTVSLNASHFAEISEVEYLRLSAKTVMGEDETFTLHLSSLNMDSREYDSAALQTLIEESQRGKMATFGMTDPQQTNHMLLIILASAVLLCTGIVAMMLSHYQKNNPEPDEERKEV